MNEIKEGGIRDELALEPCEGEFLYGLVRAIKPKVCLEIGTHKGVSTSYILEALKKNGSGHLWTTDPFEYGAKDKISFEDRTRVDFLSQRGDSIKLDYPIDFIFVDGFHDNITVGQEIENILPQLSKNAVIVFHDAQDEETNHTIGVNAALKKAGLKVVWLPTKFGLQIYQHNTIV